MMLKNKIVLVIALSAITNVTLAKGPSFDFIDVRATTSTDDTGTSFYHGSDLEGIKLKLSKELSHEFFTDLTYQKIDDSVSGDNSSQDVILEKLSVGLGYNHKVTKDTDIYAKVLFEVEKLELVSLDDEEDTGHGLAVGFINKTTSWLELSVEMFYKDVVQDSETGFNAGLQLVYNDFLSVGIDYTILEDEERASAGIRLTF